MQIVAIPTIGASKFAPRLYRNMAVASIERGIKIMVMSNLNHAEVAQQVVDGGLQPGVIVNTEGQGLYEQWGSAVTAGLLQGATAVHILNDDVILPPLSAVGMYDFMEQHRDVAMAGYDYKTNLVIGKPVAEPVVGSWRMGGIGGFAFAVNPEISGVPDCQFEWWGGDDDWVWSVLKSKRKAVLVRGLPVRHPEPEQSAVTQEWTGPAKGRDHGRLLAKWGQSW